MKAFYKSIFFGTLLSVLFICVLFSGCNQTSIDPSGNQALDSTATVTEQNHGFLDVTQDDEDVITSTTQIEEEVTDPTVSGETAEPVTGNGNAPTDNKEPTTGTEESSTGNQKPTTGNQKPTTGNQKPTTGNQKPTTPTDGGNQNDNQAQEGTDFNEETSGPLIPNMPEVSVPPIDEVTYYQFSMEMSAAEQASFINSFDSYDAFFAWKKEAYQAYLDSMDTIDGSTPIILGGGN